jgi:hypothetical protein
MFCAASGPLYEWATIHPESAVAPLRADSEAPRHPFSNIQGFASRLIGTEALYGPGADAGLQVTRADAGRDYCKLMESNGAARRIVEQMGWSLAGLLVEISLHLPAIDHVIHALGDYTVKCNGH